MTTATDARLDTAGYIETARELAGLVAANAGEINAQRRMPPDVADAIADAGFFRLLMPRELGGGAAAASRFPAYRADFRGGGRQRGMVYQSKQCVRHELYADE